MINLELFLVNIFCTANLHCIHPTHVICSDLWNKNLLIHNIVALVELLQHLQGMSQQSHALGVGGYPAGEGEDGWGNRAGRGGPNVHGSDILNATSHSLRLEKSNVLLLGPTGSGALQYMGTHNSI